MCYRNGYGYRCDCCGEDFRQKNLSSNEAVLNEIMRFMKVWNDMIEAVKYDDPMNLLIYQGENDFS